MKFQFCCLSTSELFYLIAFVNVRIGNFAAINSKIFICKFPSFFDHFPLVDTALQKAPQPDFDASVCIIKFDSFCLSDLHCLILNFPRTKEVPVFTDCLILSLPGMNRPGLVILFVVVVNTLAIEKLAELLRQLRTSDLSILLVPKQWLVGKKGDSDISK